MNALDLLKKLETWDLVDCKNLQILPSQLRLKSLRFFNLSGCSRLEKLPNFHPEMECLKTLELKGSGIREVPSSIEHLTGLCKLSLYELRRLQELSIPTAKLRPTSGYGFVNMKEVSFRGYKSRIELDLLMKPDYFPALERIDLSYTNIVTIPETISRLEKLSITNCKLLREIQGLPQSISQVFAENCMLLDIQSPSGLFNQVVEMIWILSNRVCGRARSHKVMDPQLTNYFASESEDGDISMDTQFFNRTILVYGTEVPKWFHHQSVDKSIFFFVGRKFPKFAVCIVPAQEGFLALFTFPSMVNVQIIFLQFLGLCKGN
nr:TMV resistance protein N-like [Quercus suber]